MAATHTPEPWRVHRDERGRGYEIVSADTSTGDARTGSQYGREVCRINSARNGTKRGQPVRYWEHPDDAANADFIVRACNCHDGLLAACEKALDALARHINEQRADDEDALVCIHVSEAYDLLDAAIARPEG